MVSFGSIGNMFGGITTNSVGNFVLIIALIILFVFIFCGVLIFFLYTKNYKHKIKVYGMIGNTSMLKWTDRAKEIKIGTAGDKLFYLRKQKRYLPPPTLQTGPREWWFWEREDGELINIRFDNIDENMKTLGAKFVDADMRMQRLGIEKNLQYRLQKESFWEKYGDKIINVAFYILVMIILIVLFMQWRQTAVAIEGAVTKSGEVLTKLSEKMCGPTSQGGLVPAFILIFGKKLRGGFRKF